MLRKMHQVWSRVLLGNPQSSLLGTLPGAIFGTLVCWSSTAQVFTSTSASLTSIADLTTANMIYDLDDSEDFTLRVDGSVGTGGADMYFFVPNGLFGSNEATNVYLFYQYTNFNDGTEAWTLDKNSTYVNPSGEVPEPTTLALWTLGGSLALLRRSRRKRTATLKMM